MMVWSEEPDHRPGEYEPDPEVLEQLTEFEAGGRFLAEWDGKRWRIGKRVVDNAKTSPLSPEAPRGPICRIAPATQRAGLR
jgi:hypothetical protein